MRDELQLFRDAGVQPLGVNPAATENHARYAEKLGLGFPLLSDPDRRIASDFAALKPDGKGIQRTVYAVAPDGTIAFAVRGAPPPTEVLRALRH